MRTGHVIPSPKLLEQCKRNKRFSDEAAKALWRYLRHDWGDVSDEERTANERALCQKRLFARYKTCGETILIITDETRMTTAIILEYER